MFLPFTKKLLTTRREDLFQLVHSEFHLSISFCSDYDNAYETTGIQCTTMYVKGPVKLIFRLKVEDIFVTTKMVGASSALHIITVGNVKAPPRG